MLIKILTLVFIFLFFSGFMHSKSDLQALVERQAKAWEQGDISTIVRDFAPNATFIAASYTFEGRDAIEKTVEDFFKEFTDVKITIKRIIIEKNQGAVEWDWSDRSKETNQRSEAEDAIIFEVQDDGKIIYWREYIEKKS
jgi:uncharacterized protein (TIGR02246 family)